MSTLIINHQITLNQDFAISGRANNKAGGSIVIGTAGSLVEDATPRTLSISHGSLEVAAAADRGVPRLRVSVLEVAFTQRGNFDAMVRIGANSAVQVTCLMVGNQGGIDLATNALLDVGANIDVQTGNGSVEGIGSASAPPAGIRVHGVFTGINGGTHNVFSGNLLVCVEGVRVLGACPSTGPEQTPPESNDISCRNVLPVALVRFTAQARPDGVKLDWSTATELNNDYFEVQRSPDGRTFVPIGRVAGTGTTSAGATYRFTDTAPLPGPGYYRLRQTDHNGSTAFSAVVMAATRLELAAALYPNPGTTTITLPAAAGSAISYRIYTATVRTMLAGRTAGSTSLNIQQLPAGLYLLELLADGQRHIQRFVRQ